MIAKLSGGKRERFKRKEKRSIFHVSNSRSNQASKYRPRMGGSSAIGPSEPGTGNRTENLNINSIFDVCDAALELSIRLRMQATTPKRCQEM